MSDYRRAYVPGGTFFLTLVMYNRYVSKLDQQETEMEKLRRDIETLKATEDTQQRELNDYMLGLDIS